MVVRYVIGLDNDRPLFDRVVLPAGDRLENTPMSRKYDPTIRLG
jgi:hypothetical protein